MWFRNRRSGEESSPEEDPPSPYAAPAGRRPATRGGTEPLDESTFGSTRGSGMQVDGTDFATRTMQRRQRRGSARVYPQRLGEMARGLENRQMILIGLGIVLLLLALLGWQYTRRSDDVADAEAQGDPAAIGATTTGNIFGDDFATPIASELTTVVPGDVGLPPAQGTVAAPGPSGQAFVVTGTGTEGLFLRPNPNTEGAPVATLPEGTRVEATGEEQSDGTRTWKRVRSPQGEGWVAADFLVAEP